MDDGSRAGTRTARRWVSVSRSSSSFSLESSRTVVGSGAAQVVGFLAAHGWGGQQPREMLDRQLLKRADRLLDLVAVPGVAAALGESVELGGGHLPAHRPGVKTLVVVLLTLQRRTVSQLDLHPSAVLGREASRQFRVRMDLDASQQLLDVVGGDPLRSKLLGEHLAVEQRDREQVGQRMV